VIHGIVDSVWLTKKNASESDYHDVCNAIEKRLGLPVSFEGVYRWIVFLPSKIHAELPVLNRYYGAFKSGKIKTRGIEYRRRDTPSIIKQCQRDLINYLAPARDREEFFTRLPGALRLVRGYVDRLRDGQVDTEELMITKQLSKDPAEYEHNVMQAIAAKRLAREEVQISAGQNVSYIIQCGRRGAERCVVPSELIDGPIRFDAEKYSQLLLDAVKALLSPPICDVHDLGLPRDWVQKTASLRNPL
jgi:DNA polymerase elongation subunit (family B)